MKRTDQNTDYKKAAKRLKALENLKKTMSLFPKPGQGYAGVGSVPDEDIDAKSQEYTNLLLQQPQRIKDLYSDSVLDTNGE